MPITASRVRRAVRRHRAARRSRRPAAARRARRVTRARRRSAPRSASGARRPASKRATAQPEQSPAFPGRLSCCMIHLHSRSMRRSSTSRRSMSTRSSSAANGSLLDEGGVETVRSTPRGRPRPPACAKCRTRSAAARRATPKLTRGHGLPARYVIHAVGPRVLTAAGAAEADLLASCYRRAIDWHEEVAATYGRTLPGDQLRHLSLSGRGSRPKIAVGTVARGKCCRRAAEHSAPRDVRGQLLPPRHLRPPPSTHGSHGGSRRRDASRRFRVPPRRRAPPSKAGLAPRFVDDHGDRVRQVQAAVVRPHRQAYALCRSGSDLHETLGGQAAFVSEPSTG